MLDAVTNNAINSQKKASRSLQSSLLKLSTGSKTSGIENFDRNVSILQSNTKSYKIAIQNTNNAIGINTILNSDLKAQSKILDKVRVNLIKLNSSTISATKRKDLSASIVSSLEKLDNIAKNSKYGDNFLLQKDATTKDATNTNGLRTQTGIYASDFIEIGNNIQANTKGLDLEALKANTDIQTTQIAGYETKLLAAIEKTNNYIFQSSNKAIQLQDSADALQESILATKSAISQIDGVDYASEQANYASLKLAFQSSIFSLMKTNELKSIVVDLLSTK